MVPESFDRIPLDAFSSVFGTQTGQQLIPVILVPRPDVRCHTCLWARISSRRSLGFVRAATIELSSVALGGKIISVSDEFFAEAENLLKVEVSPLHQPMAFARFTHY